MKKKILNRDLLKKTGFQILHNIKLEEVLDLRNDPNILNCSDGNYAIIQDGLNRDSLDTSWHIDGLSHKSPPLYVVLFCENKGRGDITTELTNSNSIYNKLKPEIQNNLKDIESCYLSRTGEKYFCSPLINTINENFYIALNSRGWVKGDNLTLEQTIFSMNEIYNSITPILSHYWETGDCLVFDNLKFLHKRNNLNKLIDPERRILRFWLAK